MPEDQKTLVAAVALGGIIQAIAVASLLHDYFTLGTKAKYLAKIVNRNMDKLDEFDLIALRELGLIKEIPND